MSDSEDESCIPDAKTAQARVKEFESVTNTDEIMAQMYLQENKWDLSRALNSYFASKCEDLEKTRSESQPASGPRNDPSLESALKAGLVTTKAPTSLTMISWNIDGLEEKSLQKRTEAVVKIIREANADIVFLQEVIPETFSFIQSQLTNYECIAARDDNYFVATLLRKGRVYMDRWKVTDYPTSRMDRHLLAVQAHCGSVVMDLLNTHLESTKDHATERKKQLEQCFSLMSKRPTDRSVIFGGDLNLRDPEVASLGGAPPPARDVWEQLGSREELRWTWDNQRNTNKEIPGKWKPRCRFDRIYIRPSLKTDLKAEQFGLLGLQKVEGTQSFPSDHWGILLRLVLSQEQ